MRHIHTLVITLFVNSQQPDELRGRVRHVSDGREATFTQLEDLVLLIRRAAMGWHSANPANIPMPSSDHLADAPTDEPR